MKFFLANKHILLGVTGGIAAYKSADLVRRLREAGATVRVVMTSHAKEFITPLTLQAVSGHPVHDELFDLKAEAAMGHIELARWADVIVVAPATADFMARLINGEANDLLTTLCLAASAPLALAPAMNQAMWKHTRTQENLQALQANGVHIFGPAEGSQACGDTGPGRLLDPQDIVTSISKLFDTKALSGKRVLITAGPTQEPIDPVRYISNASSGKMGYALAEAAIEADALVTIISGPVALPKPSRAKTIDVITANDMLQAVMTHAKECDIFLSVAAVSDYHCKSISPHKIAKESNTLTLELERNPDIVTTVKTEFPTLFAVGFAAETNDLIEKAKAKLKKKKLDMIIANTVGNNKGIGCEDNAVTVLWSDKQQEFSLMPKRKLAVKLIELISHIYLSR